MLVLLAPGRRSRHAADSLVATVDRPTSVDEELDMRGRRVAFARQDEFGGSLRLSRVGGGGEVLVRMPGSGAATRELTALGPAIGGEKVAWGLVVAGDHPFTEIRRVRSPLTPSSGRRRGSTPRRPGSATQT